MVAESQKNKRRAAVETMKKRVGKKVRRIGPDHPVGFHIDGTRIATLKEVQAPAIPTMSIGELTTPQRMRLAVASLSAKPNDFTIEMIGPGAINKTRAIAEVRAQSRIGKTIMEIELLMLSTLSGSNNLLR